MLSLNEEVHVCNHNEVAEYKEIMSENYREMMKESYGSVIDDEDENDVARSEILSEEDVDSYQVEHIMEDLATNNIMNKDSKNNSKDGKKEEKKEKKGLGSFLTKVMTNSQ